MAMVAAATILASSRSRVVAHLHFFNTDSWTKPSSPPLKTKAVRTQISAFLVDQLSANVDVQGSSSRGYPQAKPLAGPAAGGLRNLAGQGVDTLCCCQRPACVGESEPRRRPTAARHAGWRHHNVSTNGWGRAGLPLPVGQHHCSTGLEA